MFNKKSVIISILLLIMINFFPIIAVADVGGCKCQYKNVQKVEYNYVQKVS